MRATPAHLRFLGAAGALALIAGCANSPPSDYLTGPLPANPHVVAVYGVNIVDQAQTPAVGVLPDVQLYATPVAGSSDPHLAAPPVSPLPPAYQALRVEFDEPMDATTLTGPQDLSGAPNGPSSYCSPLASPTIQLVDDGDPAHPRTIAASVCYDATSSVGGHPHVYVIPGATGLTSTPVDPFTCQAFNPALAGSEFFASDHDYSLKITAAAIHSTAGASLLLPTATGWSETGFAFKTSGFALMAVGFQSGTNTFFYWLAKPFGGFEPNRDAVPDANTVACAPGDPADKPCRLPSDSTPYLLVFSRVLKPASVDRSSVVLQRANGSSLDYAPTAGPTTIGYPFGQTATSLGNVVTIAPGTRWEPGETYKLSLTSNIAADDDEQLTAQTGVGLYSFSAVDAALTPPVTAPAAGAVGVSISSTVTLTFQEPVAAAGIDTAHFTLAGSSGTTVPYTVAAAPDSNNQVVVLTPTAPFTFTPEASYSVSTNGLAVKEGLSKAGTAIPDLAPASFTVLPFGVALVQGYVKDPASMMSTVFQVDGSQTVNPAVLFDGSLTEVFTDAASGVTTQTLTLREQGAAASLSVTVNPADADTVAALSLSSSAAGASLQISDAAYPLKFGQGYAIHALTAIADANSAGHNLKIYPCPGSDCSDTRFFTTESYAPQLGGASATGSGASQSLQFSVTFPYPYDPASVDLANSFYAFPQKSDGSIDIGKPVTLTCSGSAPTTVTCTSTSALVANQAYLVGATFGGAFNGKTLGAAKAATPASIPTASGKSISVPVDPASGSFTGSVTAVITTNC